jgi:hypothetical protein
MRLTDALRLIVGTFDCCGVGWKTWRRPTLPCLETQYHGRWGFSRPSSGWDRVRAPREDHQVVQPIRSCRSWVVRQKARQAGDGGSGVVCVCAEPTPGLLGPGAPGDDFPLGMISMHGVPAYHSSLAF